MIIGLWAVTLATSHVISLWCLAHVAPGLLVSPETVLTKTAPDGLGKGAGVLNI